MAAKKKNSAVDYFLFLLVALCVFLVISEMYTNTFQEFQRNGSQSELMINSDEIPDYEQKFLQPSDASGSQEPTPDPFDKYGDTGE